MKLYGASPRASISMVEDELLHASLRSLSTDVPITHVLETGTYVGLGSTRFIAEILSRQATPPKLFITIEANYRSWRKARSNLRHFSFVRPVWGLSTSRREALQFIETDPVLRNHVQYPDVFIDDVQDPVRFYSEEVAGRLGGKARNPIQAFRQFVDQRLFYAGEDLLSKWLEAFQLLNPLVVLDSAGGMGYLEFRTLQKHMSRHPYFLLLDDIGHLKHFRSHGEVHANRCFTVLGENRETGWLLAKHQPAS